jgi:phosphohistidine phosphatase
MKLYLVRHGDAVSPLVNPDRPLSDLGIQQVEALAEFLEDNAIAVDHVYHSGVLRAQQTADTLASVVLESKTPQFLDGLKPEDSVDAMNALIETWSEDTMLIGHLPFMGLMVSQLILGHSKSVVVNVETASMMCLHYIGGSRWVILWMVTPDILMTI